MIVSLDLIREYLYELDPMGLADFPVMAPLDEYDGEAVRLHQWLMQQTNPSTEEVVSILQDLIFKDEVAKGERPEDYELFAKQILGMTTAHKCPVCHTTLFPSKGSCVVCDVCGWTDDLLVLENGKMLTKANPLPLRESQLEHWMLTDKRTSTRAQGLAQKRNSLTGDEYVEGLLQLFWELGTTSDISRAIEDTLDELHAWDALHDNDG